jgi:hypothetical protein
MLRFPALSPGAPASQRDVTCSERTEGDPELLRIFLPEHLFVGNG